MVEKTAYAGWPNCYRLANREIELIVTTDVGPRVIWCGPPGGPNLLKEFPEQLGKSGESTWQPRGGHRLWMAPESVPESYALDNGPVTATTTAKSIQLDQSVEPETGVAKRMTISLDGDGVTVKHVLHNHGPARRMASWGLTMMAPGGIAFTAFPPRGTHAGNLLPTNPLVMWAYTDFSDPRWKFTGKYLVLRQDPNAATPQKTGLWNRHTWEAYLLGSDLFVKSMEVTRGPECYPDMGCSLETFTNNDFLEMETLSPLETVPPGGVIGHTERWSLRRNVRISEWSDDELDRATS